MNFCNDQTDVQHHEERKNKVIMPIGQHCPRVLDRVGQYLINKFLSNSTGLYTRQTQTFQAIFLVDKT